MNKQLIFVVATCAVASAASFASASVSPLFPLVEPAGWSVGTPLSTSQDWAASAADPITGVPNVVFNDAGAGLTAPTLTTANGGFVASSGGLYSFSTPYTATASLVAPTAGVPAGAGTYVIVQTFGTVNPDFGSVLGMTLTDFGGTPLAGAQHLHSELYSYLEEYSSPFGVVPAQASIDEFWVPGFVGDFKAVANLSVHSSLQEIRVDTILALPGAGDSSPFALTAVPEPASCGLLGVAAIGLLGRRRRATA